MSRSMSLMTLDMKRGGEADLEKCRDLSVVCERGEGGVCGMGSSHAGQGATISSNVGHGGISTLEGVESHAVRMGSGVLVGGDGDRGT